MSPKDKKRTAYEMVVTRILQGSGQAPRAQRSAAFEDAGLVEPVATLIDKVAKLPSQISDEDVATVKAAGLSEDEIFELVVCAAVGQASRQYETALAALAEALTDKTTADKLGSEYASDGPQ